MHCYRLEIMLLTTSEEEKNRLIFVHLGSKSPVLVTSLKKASLNPNCEEMHPECHLS